MPTATHAAPQAMNEPPALAVYLHWPFCKSKCPYCDFNSHVRDTVDQARWQRAMLTELATMAERVGPRRVVSIFFGGGTPSLMPPETAAALIEAVQTYWPGEVPEITLEANPTSVEAEAFRAFRDAGVNRLSLGIQALNADDLGFLGREHSVEEALAALRLAQETFPRYSFDLIYARPGQNVAGWTAELQEALSYAGDHLSLYQLTIEPDTPFARFYRAGDFQLPDDETAAALYETTEALLRDAGLAAYEVSNYARPSAACRHNLAYWRGEDYLGVGPGAHGRLSDADGCYATSTYRSPERWLERVERDGQALETDSLLSPEERRQEMVMTGLRLMEGITLDDYRDLLRPDKLAHYLACGLLEQEGELLRTTPEGRLVLNRLIGELLI